MMCMLNRKMRRCQCVFCVWMHQKTLLQHFHNYSWFEKNSTVLNGEYCSLITFLEIIFLKIQFLKKFIFNSRPTKVLMCELIAVFAALMIDLKRLSEVIFHCAFKLFLKAITKADQRLWTGSAPTCLCILYSSVDIVLASY